MLTRILTLLLVLEPRRLPKWILPVLDAAGLAAIRGHLELPAFILEREGQAEAAGGLIMR